MKCKEKIYQNWRSHQCNRKPGHGPDEAYCRQHAKKYDGTAEKERLARAIEKGKSGGSRDLQNALFDASSLSGIPIPAEVDQKRNEYVRSMRDALAEIEKQVIGGNDEVDRGR